MATDRDALKYLKTITDTSSEHLVQHYLYFPEEATGKMVAAELRECGFTVIDRLGAGEDNEWLVLAKHQIIPSEEAIEQLRDFLEEVAEKHGGEYDGWEMEVKNDQSS